MARPGSEYPTDLELDILKVLWIESPLPVREVRARLARHAHRELAHSSVITMLNIMVRKGYVARRKVGKAFHFSPIVQKGQVTRRALRDLVRRMFEGSTSAMVCNLLETSDLDTDELQEIRKLIARKAKEQS